MFHLAARVWLWMTTIQLNPSVLPVNQTENEGKQFKGMDLKKKYFPCVPLATILLFYRNIAIYNELFVVLQIAPI